MPKSKYRKDCIIQFPDGELLCGEMASDGLIFIFPNELALRLDILYPTHDSHGWFFNDSKDRYVAEREHDGISINPSFVRTYTVACLVE